MRTAGDHRPYVLVLALVCACSSSATPSEPVASATPAATRLAFDLPFGTFVSVDGQQPGATPLPAIDVAPGAHAIEVVTACGTAKLSAFEVAEGSTTTLDRGDLPTLRFATLRVVARDLRGEALEPTVSLGGATLAKVPSATELLVAACPQRLRVAVDGLGSYYEDKIEFDVDALVERDLVLAPGPDMVRIKGADFTIGPTKHALGTPYDDDYDGTFEEEDGGRFWGSLKRYDVHVTTFDLDRTEVTVEQYAACRKAAKQPSCASDEECTAVGGCPQHRQRKPASPHDNVGPYPNELSLCNMRIWSDDLDIAKGRENHPANCLDRFAAEDYCRWVGKRLPTDVEWEFAARSRNPDYDCPRGRADYCARPGGPHTKPPCSFADGTSEQGLCDMMDNVSEYVADAVVAGRPARASSKIVSGCMGAPWTEGGTLTSFQPVYCPDYRRQADVGFRCARDVPSSLARAPGGAR